MENSTENFDSDSITKDEMSSGSNEENKRSKRQRSIELSPKRLKKACSPNEVDYSSGEYDSNSQESSNSDTNYFENEEEHSQEMSIESRRRRRQFWMKILPRAEMLAQIKKISCDRLVLNGPEAFTNINRNKEALTDERFGKIELHVICNSMSKPIEDKIVIWLLQLRNVFAHGLPDMDRSYITKLVFDWKHRNLVLVENGDVIGGICFRMFPTRNFSEIVFLAISSNNHVKGYGSHLMNHLKDYHISRNIRYLLTYAAYEAFGYFQKQGFSHIITVPESVYKGYINDYDGARLMQCELQETVKYTEFYEIISKYKKIIHEYLRYEDP